MEVVDPHAPEGPMGSTYMSQASGSQSSLGQMSQPISSASAYVETSTQDTASTIAGPSEFAQPHARSSHVRTSSGPNAAILSAAAPPPDAATTRSAALVSHALLEAYKHTIAEAESYIAVFDTKARLEEDYVRGLKSISEKTRDTLLRLDDRTMPGDLPGIRQVWRDMLQNQMREMDSRMHYVETLRKGVLAPLVNYRDAQERIRKRVKEDLKASIAEYDDMRNHHLPRAKKVYDKRCEEVEGLRVHQQAIEDQRMLLSQAHSHPHEVSISGPASGEAFSPSSSAAYSDQDDEYHRSEPDTAATSPGRSSSLKVKRVARRGGSDGSDMSGPHQTSASESLSPRLGGDANLLNSPPLPVGHANAFGGNSQEAKKSHFLEALRSRENWETARKEAPKKLNALFSRMRDGPIGGSDRVDTAGTGAVTGTSGGVFAMSPELGATGPGGLSLGGGPGSVRSTQNIALRHVKAKREAEEADAAYRKAVFDLETLRLRREKRLMAARTSILEARRDLYTTCQATWIQAEKSAQSLANASLSNSEHVEDVLRHSLDHLDAELETLNARLPMVDEKRVRYINFHVGECRDLIFGVSLVDYAFSRAQRAAPQLGPGKAEAPLIVRKCIAFIEERALEQPGIYRTSAKHTAIQNLAHALERDEERFEFGATIDEPAAVAGVLKLYLRKLPDPVLPMPWEERVRYTHERQEHVQTGFASLKGRIRRLPAPNQATLRAIVEHLAKVAAHSEQNKMTASNLSIIFGPLLLSQADHETTSIAAAMEEDRVTEDMITYADTIFDLARAGAPILPPVASTATQGKTETAWNYLASPSGPLTADTATVTASHPEIMPHRQQDESSADLESTIQAFPVPESAQADPLEHHQLTRTRTALQRFSLDDASSWDVDLHSAAPRADHQPLAASAVGPSPLLSSYTNQAPVTRSMTAETFSTMSSGDDTMTTPTVAATLTSEPRRSNSEADA